MATQPNAVDPAQIPQIAPEGGALSVADLSEAQRREIAKRVIKTHQDGLQKKRQRDLTAEKYMMHVDGENDGQWAEIVNGKAIIVPPRLGTSLRFSRNLLRPMTDNFVSYMTSIPIRFAADSKPGRHERDMAAMDTLLANHVVLDQNVNELLTHAMYMCAVYGSCPVHSQWRYDDMAEEQYDPLWNPQGGGMGGHIDVWVGDPFDTVYGSASTRSSIHWMSYGRTMPTELVRSTFASTPGIEDLRGDESQPSASRFQKIAYRWQHLNHYWNGASIISQMADNSDEMTAVVCLEIAPGVDPLMPQGALVIVALQNNATTEHWSSRYNAATNPILLHIGPLPAGRFSAVRFYAHDRWDDPYGKPYVADLSPLNQQLNQIVTLRAERLRRYSTPQLMARAGSIEDDTVIADPTRVMHINSGEYPQFLAPPMGNPDYDAMIAETQTQMFRIGGWQAASRGEGKAGDAASKVIALARADDTIFGPMARAYHRSLVDMAGLWHALFRRYAEAPLLSVAAGEDQAHLVGPWINKGDLSTADPNYFVASGFGSTPEATAQVLQNMVVMRGSDGVPLLTTEEFWQRYPDPSIRPHRSYTESMKRRRQNAVKYAIETLADQVMAEYPEEIQDPNIAMQMAQAVSDQVAAVLPVLRTENPEASIMALDELVQDPMTPPVTRMAAEFRQAVYFEWMQQMMTPNMVAEGQPMPGQQREQGPTGTPVQSDANGGTQGSNQIADSAA